MRHLLLISALLVSPLFGGEQVQKKPVQKPAQKQEPVQKMSRRDAILNLKNIYYSKQQSKQRKSCCGAINPWCQKAQDARDRAIAKRMAEVQIILRNQQ